MEEQKKFPRPLLSQIMGLHDDTMVIDAALARLKMLDGTLGELQVIASTFAQKTREGVALIQENKVVWANQAARDITGYSDEELMSLPPRELAPPAFRDRYEARLRMFMAGDTIEMPEEWPLLRKDRTIKYVNAFTYRVNYLTRSALLIFFYDITESKKIRDESLMREQILDSINDAVFLLEESGKIVYVNTAMCEMTGYTKNELLNMNIIDITAPELRKKFSIRARQFSEHKEARYSTISIARDGSRIPIEVRGKIVKLGGKSLGLGVARELPAEGR